MSYFCHIYYCTKKKEENQKELSKRLLTYGFWHSFGISYEESMIERRSNGKPYYIRNENEIFFNLSHGQELIAVACADCEVGIDAESMRKVRENAMRRTCTRKEWEWLQQSEQKELDFLRDVYKRQDLDRVLRLHQRVFRNWSEHRADRAGFC